MDSRGRGTSHRSHSSRRTSCARPIKNTSSKPRFPIWTAWLRWCSSLPLNRAMNASVKPSHSRMRRPRPGLRKPRVDSLRARRRLRPRCEPRSRRRRPRCLLRRRHLCAQRSKRGLYCKRKSRMLRRPQHNSVAQVLFRAALLTLLPPVAWATDGSELAPAAPDKPWIIPPPSDGAARAGVLNYRGRMRSLEQGNAVPIEPDRRYSLAELIDLAQRSNPETREAWEQARQAALAVGLVESSYAPQISVEAVSGFQRTPLPIPTTLIHKGYFTSDTRELIPMLSLKWLLFDFGRRAGLDEAARANSFVANVAFTGAHQKLIFAVSRAYFALGAARGRLKAAQQALETAETVQDAAQSRREHGLGTVVVLAQGQRQVAQARFTLTKASGDERTAYANLIATLGVAADAQINIADSSEQPLPAEPPDNVETLLRDALTNRPDVVAALGKIDAAEAELKSQRAAYYP